MSSLLNDTFDNISFSISTNNIKNCDNNGSIRTLKSDDKLRETYSQIFFNTIDDETEKILLDDTQFLAEFNIDCNDGTNTEISDEFQTNISANGFNGNVADSSTRTKSNETIENLLSTCASTDEAFSTNILNTKENTLLDTEDLAPSLPCKTNRTTQMSKIIQTTDCDNLNDADIPTSNKLSAWGLPQAILEKYETHKVVNMFNWQVQCLSNPLVLKEHRNLVYSAPTSAGKTLVAEILAIKTVLEMKKKVLFVLPFVSVVREKMFYFQDILSSSGVRVEGFMGSYNPPGGFSSVNIAICTMEKANSVINRLLEEKRLEEIGAVVIDEMHLLSDSSRGYQLELLLTKLKYMTQRDDNINIQIIGMSATLPNLDLLAKWLDAELFITNFRPVPLKEQCHCNGEIYDTNLTMLRKLDKIEELEMDTDNILQLCLETIFDSCSVLIFCPTKKWCESLSQQIAMAFWKICNSKTELSQKLLKQLNGELILEVLEQLRGSPVGLDKHLECVISFAVSFHHAGLTMDERDIIEGAFKRNVIRVLVATSTLSSGVNLPARRVIIRTPIFHGKSIDPLTYRQMIGRAGRMGRDSSGESLLICQKNDYAIAKELMSAKLPPIESCLEGSGRLKRAILEIIASEVASAPSDIAIFAASTLLAANSDMSSPIEDTIEFLIENEFVRLQMLDVGSSKYFPTPLGKACLSSSMPPEEGLLLFAELQKARQCFVLDTELHIIYLVTPYSVCNQLPTIDWISYLEMWEKLSASMKRVGELVGVSDFYLVSQARGKIQVNSSKSYHRLQIHKRFYTALALQDLVSEVPLNEVAKKFNCNRGLLQSLQQSASSFAGMVTTFSRQLGWSSVEILVSQFQDRLQFGVSRDLLDLMKLPVLDAPKARALYNNGIDNLIRLAASDPQTLENILYKSTPFESEKALDGENEFDAKKRNKMRNIWIAGQQGLTVREAADVLINYARKYLEYEMGVAGVRWDKYSDCSNTSDISHKSANKSNLDKPLLNLPNNTLMNVSLDINKHSTPNKIQQLSLESDALVQDVSTPNNSLFSECDSFDKAFNKESIIELNKNKGIRDSGYELNNFSGDLFDSAEIVKKVDQDNNKLSTSNNLGIDWGSDIDFETQQLEEDQVLDQMKEPGGDDSLLNIVTAIEKVDISEKRKNSSNTSDLINNSCSPLRQKTKKKKRQRTSLGDESCKTPTKKARKKGEISYLITDDGLSLDTPYSLCMGRQFNNFSSLEIIDVCANVKLFNNFVGEVAQKKLLSLSLACSKIQEKPRIGLNITNNKTVNDFTYKDVSLDGISFSWGENVAYYLSLNHVVPSVKIINFLKNFFQKDDVLIRIFDCKEQIKMLKNCGNVSINCKVEDPKVASWIMEPEVEKNLLSMTLTHVPDAMDLAQIAGNTKSNGSLGLELCSSIEGRIRSSVEAILTYHVSESINVLFRQNPKYASIFKLEMNSILCLSKMELHGFKMDVENMKELVETLKQICEKLTKKAYQIAGRRFSFTSAKEVSKIIGIFNGKRVSTCKQILEQNEHPISKLVLKWRKLNTILTNMIYPLLRMIDNSRVHCNCITFNSTGRVSMHEPNLQNIPKDFEIEDPLTGYKTQISCRSKFIASSDCILVSADYCQLELRLLTHLCQDKLLCYAMKSDQDVFKLIAAKWNNVGVDEVNDKMRQNAKQICYGIIYGMGTKALAEQMHISVEEADSFIETFHNKYTEIKQYVQKTIDKCRINGYVETIIGRRRYLPHINHNDNAIKKQAERQAVNTTIQGSAADIAKNAMILIEKNIDMFKKRPKLVLQLHDELIYDVPIKHQNNFARILKNCMENSVKLSVPFPVKLKAGLSWGTLEEYHI